MISEGSVLGTLALPQYFTLSFEVLGVALNPMVSCNVLSLRSTDFSTLPLAVGTTDTRELSFLYNDHSLAGPVLPADFATQWCKIEIKVTATQVTISAQNGASMLTYAVATVSSIGTPRVVALLASDIGQDSAGGYIRNIQVSGAHHSRLSACLDVPHRTCLALCAAYHDPTIPPTAAPMAPPTELPTAPPTPETTAAPSSEATAPPPLDCTSSCTLLLDGPLTLGSLTPLQRLRMPTYFELSFDCHSLLEDISDSDVHNVLTLLHGDSAQLVLSIGVLFDGSIVVQYGSMLKVVGPGMLPADFISDSWVVLTFTFSPSAVTAGGVDLRVLSSLGDEVSLSLEADPLELSAGDAFLFASYGPNVAGGEVQYIQITGECVGPLVCCCKPCR